MCFIASLAIEQNPVAEIFGLASVCFLFPGLFLDMHSTASVFNHIKQSWATTWQTKHIKSRSNAIIALFTMISGSVEEGGDPTNTLTNNSDQESIVAMPFRTLYEDTPPHSGPREHR